MVKKNIFLTGSNGYLGSIIKEKLKNRFNIVISQEDRKLKKFKNLAILHLAALDKKNCEKKKKLAYRINVNKTTDILNLSKKYNFKKIIFFSSVHVYGKKTKIIRENHKLKPQNNYGLTKKKSEELLLRSSKEIEIVIFRLSNVVAKPLKENKQSKNLIVNYLCRKLIKGNIKIKSNGYDTRDFITINYLLDCINYFLKPKNNGVFNICSGKLLTIIRLCKIISKFNYGQFNYKNMIKFGKRRIDNFDLKYSNGKISKLVPIKSRHNLNLEIYRTIKFYKNNKTL